MNARMSPADYNATLPNNYRHIQAQLERATGMPVQSSLPARSNRTDQLAGVGSGLPVDSQSASYTGSGAGMIHEDGRMKYQLDGQSRSQYSQNYDHDIQRAEEQQRIAYYSNKPQVDEQAEESQNGVSHRGRKRYEGANAAN